MNTTTMPHSCNGPFPVTGKGGFCKCDCKCCPPPFCTEAEVLLIVNPYNKDGCDCSPTTTSQPNVNSSAVNKFSSKFIKKYKNHTVTENQSSSLKFTLTTPSPLTNLTIAVPNENPSTNLKFTITTPTP